MKIPENRTNSFVILKEQISCKIYIDKQLVEKVMKLKYLRINTHLLSFDRLILEEEVNNK